MNQPIGFVGLGIMGRPIVRNLCRAGLSLRVYDVNPDACAALEEYGAKRGTLCEIAETCDLIMLCLPTERSSTPFSLTKMDCAASCALPVWSAT